MWTISKSKNEKNTKKLSYTILNDTNHRRKGLVFLMYGATSLLFKEKNIIYGGGPIPSDNFASTEVAKALGGGTSRTHIILEYNLGDKDA